ncbi:MAG: DNA gyrase subunit A [Acidimicrobiales bacterium]
MLYSMYRMRLLPENSHRKCAHVIAMWMGKFHPHGDAAIYDALVRLGQDFAKPVMLIDPQGNSSARSTIPPPPSAPGVQADSGRASISSPRSTKRPSSSVPPMTARPRNRRPSGPPPEPVGQRHVRDRRRHGHEHADPQPGAAPKPSSW